jgi:dTDP-glucose pyrophosphorylase
MEELTPNPQQSISAAFDSVNLINNTILEIVNNNNKSTITRNVQHLEIMLSKEWFLEALTQQQLTDINSCIENGNLYNAKPITEETVTEEVASEETPTEETVTEEVASEETPTEETVTEEV